MAALMVLAPMLARAEGTMHMVAVHVGRNDPGVMNMALNNIANLTGYLESQGDLVMVELVACGPGLMRLVPCGRPVADQVSAMSLEHENLSFADCANSHREMSEKAGKEAPLMEEAKTAPSGVVRLIELREQGYAYIRP